MLFENRISFEDIKDWDTGAFSAYFRLIILHIPMFKTLYRLKEFEFINEIFVTVKPNTSSCDNFTFDEIYFII